jgi:hypothetical protein
MKLTTRPTISGPEEFPRRKASHAVVEEVPRSAHRRRRPARPSAADPDGDTHFINGHPLKGPYPDGLETAVFAMGCFWGVERIFWKIPGVYVTAAGYAAGITPNPTYEEVCSGRTATPRLCWWCSTPRPSPTRRC